MLKNIKIFFERASQKNKDFFLSSVYNFLFIGVKLILNLKLFSLLLEYMGEERFGVWQTIFSIGTFITVLNFGYANSLRNLITKNSLNHSNKIGELIGVITKKVFFIALTLSVVFIPIIYIFLKPDLLFFKISLPYKEIKISTLILISFFLLNLILGLSDSVAYGLQKSHLTSFFQTLYVLGSYLLVYFLGQYYTLNLIDIAIIFGLAQTISYLLFIIYQKNKFKIRLDFSKKIALGDTNKLSFHFFLAHLLSIVFLLIDNFIISSTLGAKETASYSVINKIYFTLIMLFSILLIHFWNSVTEAFEKKEFIWIKKTIKTLIVISFFVFFIGLIIAFFQETIINLWIKNNTPILQRNSFYIFSFYVLFHCINAVFVNLQNGLGQLKIQIYVTFFLLLVYLLGCYLLDIKKYGYNSIIILKTVLMFFSLIFNSLILRKLKK